MSSIQQKQVVLSGVFDGIQRQDVILLHRASLLGPVHVYLWDDALVASITGHAPKFPLEERLYYLDAVRFVNRVTVVSALADPEKLPVEDANTAAWVVRPENDTEAKRTYCQERGITYHVERDLAAPPDVTPVQEAGESGKKVLVTGCFDWLHTGHIRFFEEVSELGDLYVVVGHDANIRALKGEGHPMFSQEERRYLVSTIRFVHTALISTGDGWLDAEPEIERIHPDMYAVNEDGDKQPKREYCAAHGIEYVVLKRLPKPGLPRRESTHLRGF